MLMKKTQNSCSRYLMWLLGMLLSIQFVVAQSEQNITGVVLDELGDPVIGATVSIVGSSRGTITDIQGNFTIKAAPNSVLTFSFIGYAKQNINIGSRKSLKVVLKEDAKQLDEVVVTAMGITREAKSLSYARQSIGTDDMAEVRGANMLDMLTGKAAGMQVVSGGGPLASTRVVLRGSNSVTGNNQPLYVVDGVPILNNMGEDGNDLDFGNAANNINPDEIENIEVLKGANASALYGSDAANGVILITTKKAKAKRGLGVSYGLNIMFGSLYSYPTYQNIYGAGQSCLFERKDQGVNYYGVSNNGVSYNPNLPYGIWNPNMANQDQRSWGMPMLGFEIVGRNGEVKRYEPHPETVEDMYQTSTMITNSVSIDKVTDNASVRLSYTNIHSDDILAGFNELDRHTFNLRSTAKITKFLDMDASVRYVYEDVENRGFRNASNRNPLYIIANLPRDATVDELKPWKKPDGTAYNFQGFNNPYWVLNETGNADNKHWLMGNLTFDIKLNEMFKIRLRGATDVQISDGWSFTNLNTPFDTDGEYQRWKREWKNTNFDGLLSFSKRILNNKLSINANAGVSSQNISGSKMDSKASMLQFPDMISLSNAKGLVSALEERERKKKNAVFGMASFGYADWLFLDATARNEWTSALARDNNSYFYYSVGSGILLSEAFKLDKHLFPYIKIRGSYAQVGNDTGYDRLRSGYYKAEDASFLGIPYYMGDDILKTMSLKPEKTKSWEVGADIRLLDERISVDFTYYKKFTVNQIVEADAPLGSGYRKEIINAGRVENKGVELSFTVIPVKTKLVTWSSSFNWSKNKSMVVELAEGIDRYEMGSGDNIKLYAQAGKPYGVFYGNDYKRDENGNICVGLDGKMLYVTDQYLGELQADWFGGWRNNLRIGDFDLGIAIDFQKGGQVWSYTAFRGGIDGNTVQSLDGRYEFLVSQLVLGENDRERHGVLDAQYTVRPGADEYNNHVIYPDWQRPKGVYVPGTVYDESIKYWAGQESMSWIRPMDHWTHNNSSSAARYLYDASYVKLREVSVGYTVPSKYLRKTFLRSAKISAVGRNVAILFQNTPKGMDPQATSTTGNAQGFERGFSLPQASWGFDLKVSF